MIEFKKDVTTLIKISDERRDKGDLIGAISVLLNDCLYFKKDSIIYKKLGELYLLTGDYDSSAFNYLKYADLCPLKEKKEAILEAVIACIRGERDKFAVSLLEEFWKFFSNGENVYQEEVYDFLNSVELKEKPKFKLVEKDKRLNNFNKGVQAYYEKDYEKAIEELSCIEKDSKYYEQSILKLGVCYFMKEDKEKSLEKLYEYFNNYKPSIEQFCSFINILDVYSGMDKELLKQRDFYLEKLLSQKITKNSDNFLIAEFLVTMFSDYEKALKYINQYLRNEPYDDGAIFMKSVCLYLTDKKEFGVRELKKAYMLTHSCKYKFVLDSMKNGLEDKKHKLQELYDYPLCLKKNYLNIIKECIKDKNELNKLSIKDCLEMVDYACDLDNKKFWLLVVELFSKGEKNFFTEILGDLLLFESLNVEIKSSIIEVLAYKGYAKSRGVALPDFYTRINFLSTEDFKNDSFKRAFCFVYGRLPVFINREFIINAQEFEEKYISAKVDCIKEDLAGAILIYCLQNKQQVLANFFKILKTNKTKSKKLLEEILNTKTE